MFIYPLRLKTDTSYVLVNFIALQHLFLFKYHIDKEIYVKFLIQIHQKNYVTFACLFKGYFIF